MKKTIFMLLVIGMMAATQQNVVSAQTTTTHVSFTSQIGDSVSYSAFELAEIISFGQSPSDDVANSVLDEYATEFPDNCGEDSPAISVLQYDEGEFICLQHNTDGEIISICMKTIEDGWIESDPDQENILWKLSLLTVFSENLFR